MRKEASEICLERDYYDLPCTAKDPRRATNMIRLREDIGVEDGSTSIAAG